MLVQGVGKVANCCSVAKLKLHNCPAQHCVTDQRKKSFIQGQQKLAGGLMNSYKTRVVHAGDRCVVACVLIDGIARMEWYSCIRLLLHELSLKQRKMISK
jgi:hypothetical protein